MRSEQELRDAVRRTAESLESDPDLAAVRRRARVLRTRRAVGGIVVAGLLAAAVLLPLRALTPIGEPPPPPQPAEQPDAQVPEGVFFPTLAERPNGYPTALIIGTIEERYGCLRIGESLVLWPHGWAIRERDGALTVLDEEGGTVLTVGDWFEGGGGSVGGGEEVAFPEHLIGEPIPHRCRSAGYWLLAPWLKVLDEEGDDGVTRQEQVLAVGHDLEKDWRLLAWRWGNGWCLSLDPFGGNRCTVRPRTLMRAVTPVAEAERRFDIFVWGAAPADTALITAEADDGRIVQGRLFPIEGVERLVPYLVVVEDVRSVLLDATDADGDSIDQYRWYP